jgi:hypothetical protein
MKQAAVSSTYKTQIRCFVLLGTCAVPVVVAWPAFTVFGGTGFLGRRRTTAEVVFKLRSGGHQGARPLTPGGAHAAESVRNSLSGRQASLSCGLG